MIDLDAEMKAAAERRALELFNKLPDAALVPRDVAAAVLGLSTRTLANWAAIGRHTDKLPPVKCSRLVRYRVADLRAVVQDGLGH